MNWNWISTGKNYQQLLQFEQLEEHLWWLKRFHVSWRPLTQPLDLPSSATAYRKSPFVFLHCQLKYISEVHFDYFSLFLHYKILLVNSKLWSHFPFETSPVERREITGSIFWTVRVAMSGQQRIRTAGGTSIPSGRSSASLLTCSF